MCDANQVVRVIPPNAMWALAEALATAACLMKRGALPYDPSPPDWQEVIHMDIKPAVRQPEQMHCYNVARHLAVA